MRCSVQRRAASLPPCVSVATTTPKREKAGEGRDRRRIDQIGGGGKRTVSEGQQQHVSVTLKHKIHTELKFFVLPYSLAALPVQACMCEAGCMCERESVPHRACDAVAAPRPVHKWNTAHAVMVEHPCLQPAQRQTAPGDGNEQMQHARWFPVAFTTSKEM